MSVSIVRGRTTHLVEAPEVQVSALPPIGTELEAHARVIKPRIPVEAVPPSRQRPPFCPNPNCRHHATSRRARYADYTIKGSYVRRTDGRRITKFRCKACGRYFSWQTFAFTYRMRKPHRIVGHVAELAVGSMSQRRIASALGRISPSLACHQTTVMRILNRLGDQALLASESMRRELGAIVVDVVLDPFRTFVAEQENALSIAMPIARRSRCILAVRSAWHRQATARSKVRARVAPSPGDRERCIEEVLDALFDVRRDGSTVRVVSDGEECIRDTVARHARAVEIDHAIFPNPPDRRRGEPRSAEAIARDRAMWVSDDLHRQLRHFMAEHRRETIAFGRCGKGSIGRAALFTVWWNLKKMISLRASDSRTPAMLEGIAPRPLDWNEIFAIRRFESRTRTSPYVRAVLAGALRDPRLRVA